MSPRARAVVPAVLVAIAIAGAGAGPLAAAPGPQTMLVSHPEQAAWLADPAVVRAVFLMRVRTWPDGKPVRLFAQPPNSPLHLAFCREQLATYPYVLSGLWSRVVNTGRGRAPTIVEGDLEMREQVRATPGAIGYIAVPGK